MYSRQKPYNLTTHMLEYMSAQYAALTFCCPVGTPLWGALIWIETSTDAHTSAHSVETLPRLVHISNDCEQRRCAAYNSWYTQATVAPVLISYLHCSRLSCLLVANAWTRTLTRCKSRYPPSPGMNPFWQFNEMRHSCEPLVSTILGLQALRECSESRTQYRVCRK